MIYGIFVGYCTAPGYRFGGKYKCFSLDDFVGKSLDIDVDPSEYNDFWGHEYITSKIWVPPGDFQFPLKEEYERVNYTLKGRSNPACREIPHPDFDFAAEAGLLPPILEDDYFPDDVQPATPPDEDELKQNVDDDFNPEDLLAVPQTPIDAAGEAPASKQKTEESHKQKDPIEGGAGRYRSTGNSPASQS